MCYSRVCVCVCVWFCRLMGSTKMTIFEAIQSPLANGLRSFAHSTVQRIDYMSTGSWLHLKTGMVSLTMQETICVSVEAILVGRTLWVHEYASVCVTCINLLPEPTPVSMTLWFNHLYILNMCSTGMGTLTRYRSGMLYDKFLSILPHP